MRQHQSPHSFVTGSNASRRLTPSISSRKVFKETLATEETVLLRVSRRRRHSVCGSKGLLSEAAPFLGRVFVDVGFPPRNRAVEREFKDRPNYATCAANPGRISKTSSEAAS